MMPFLREPPIILIVENDQANRILAERVLELVQYQSIAVSNGREALDLLAERLAQWTRSLLPGQAATPAFPVDFILTDLSMPVLDGMTMIRLIRSQSVYDHIPIVALTASASRMERQRVLRMGCVDVLTKPYHPKELLDIIARHLPRAPEEQHANHSTLLRGAPRDHGSDL